MSIYAVEELINDDHIKVDPNAQGDYLGHIEKKTEGESTLLDSDGLTQVSLNTSPEINRKSLRALAALFLGFFTYFLCIINMHEM